MIGVCKYKKLNFLGPRKQRLLLMIRGVLGTISLILIFYAVKFVNPSDVSAIFNCNIVIVTIFARFFLKEKFTFAHILALIFTVFGIFLVSQPSFLFPKHKMSENNFQDHLILYDIDSVLDDLDVMNQEGNNCTKVKLIMNETDQVDLTKRFNVLNEYIKNSSKMSHKYSLTLGNALIILKNLHDDCKDKKEDSTIKQIIGFSISIIAALSFSFVAILLKKLAAQKIHFSLILIFSSYIGLPVSIAISLIMLLAGFDKKNPDVYTNAQKLITQIAFALSSAFCGILSQVLMSLSLVYEDASKMTLFKSADLFFVFILQYIIVNIKTNMYSQIGAFLIFVGILTIMIFKIFDKRNDKKKRIIHQQNALNFNKKPIVLKQNFLTKIIFFKF
jgi:drug/metabolite transporter (DMT)-like permease